MEKLRQIHNDLRCGKSEAINFENSKFVNDVAVQLLSSQSLTEEDFKNLELILEISNILYNNTDREVIFLEDGLYDLLIKLYERNSPNGSYPVGAVPVKFESTANDMKINEVQESYPLLYHIDPNVVQNSFYMNDYNLGRLDPVTPQCYIEYPIDNSDIYITKRQTIVPHKYPKLVGTLDKCKFVLTKDAIEKGVQDDKNVNIFERDFLGKHLQQGFFSHTDIINLVAELKYDGISVEAEVSDRVISARTRGDTDSDSASDLTPLLEGYPFKKAIGVIDPSNVFGMKFEAVITKDNLYKLSLLTGKEYKNGRVAIIGLTGSSEGRKYRDLITLVPLATSITELNRLEEIEFMNKYYTSGECLRYAIIQGDYVSCLYQVNKFVQEAEYLRNFIHVMYDGVVISYTDPHMINALGRVNSVNKYSVAIKFNALKRQTIFTGYEFSVGQNGIITPMIHYQPVEFYGTIHTKSSGHSFERFKDLSLAIGDIIDVEYVNDVMPYVTKPDNEHNRSNPNPPVEFIQYCPSCGSPLVMSQTGKSVVCPNGSCPSRNIMRMTNMLHKLGVKDFSEESLKKINKYSLYDLFKLRVEDLEHLGETNSVKFVEQMNLLKTQPIPDYKMVGSIGFTNIALDTWKLILNNMSLDYIISWNDADLYNTLITIKGIGPTTATTIISEREWFLPDLMTINAMPNVIRTFGIKSTGKVIRFSGIRDQQLCDTLNKLGHDASDGALTKKTDILIIPMEGYSSKKTQTAIQNHTAIYPYEYFVNNMTTILK